MFRDKMFYISSSAIAVIIIIGVLTFSILTSKNKNTNVDIAQENTNIGTQEASTSIETPLNETPEVMEIPVAEEENSEPKTGEVKENKEKSQVKENIEKESTPVAVPTPDPTFILPVDGEVMKDYAKDKLVYSTTLKEWVTHLGIDIKADKTTVVKSASAGTVKAIKNDPRYGLSVVVEHGNGYSTVYSNLLTAEFVVVGEKVEQGQTIGTVGNTASFEILDEPHLHFEIQKDGVQVDPNMYLQ